MDVSMMRLDQIRPYENNPRKNDEAVDKVAASIREFGFKQPIVVDCEGVIIAGHTRYRAAKKLGLDEVPVLVADDLSPEQVRAYRLADNKTAEFSGWDFDLLDQELFEIDDIDMAAFGFDMSAVEELPPAEEDDGYTETDPETIRTAPGDVYQLGQHRLVCGDATLDADVGLLMDGSEADVVFTDPPYGMGLDTDYTSMESKFKGSKGGQFYEPGSVDSFSPEMIDACFSVGAPELFLWGADYYAELLPDRNEGSWIVWDKRSNDEDNVAADESSDKMFGSCFELCWSRKKHKRDIARVKWAGIFGLEKEHDHKRLHPTQKPVRLASWFLEKYSRPQDIVVDLFGGSGSTMIACEQLNRKCYMMELDPRYCDIIIDRWEQFTGGKAELINGQ